MIASRVSPAGVQAAGPGREPERLVFRSSSRAARLDGFRRHRDGIVDGAARQRKLRSRLDQTQLPEPLMPSSGGRGVGDRLLEKMLAGPGLWVRASARRASMFELTRGGANPALRASSRASARSASAPSWSKTFKCSPAAIAVARASIEWAPYFRPKVARVLKDGCRLRVASRPGQVQPEMR